MSRDPLAEVFADHSVYPGPDERICRCGLRFPNADEHRLHVAAEVRAFLTSDETVERVARATTGCFANSEPDSLEEWEPWDAGWWLDTVRAALAAATETRP